MRKAAAGLLLIASLPAAAGSVLPVAELHQARSEIDRFLREAREEALVHRVAALRDALNSARRGTDSLRSETARLRDRADAARIERAPDRFFAFHLSRVRRDAWTRRLDIESLLGQVQRLDGEIVPGKKLAEALGEAEDAARRLLDAAAALDTESLALEASVSVTEPALLGRGAAHDAARLSSEVRSIVMHSGMAQSGLHDQRKRAKGGAPA